MRVIRVLPHVACVVALAGAAGCSSSGSGTTTASSSAVVAQRITITIKGSSVTPAPSQVTLPVGKALEVVVTSDHDDELHAHGFDVEEPLKAGTPTTLRLVGTEPGVYEVETHEPALTILRVAVR